MNKMRQELKEKLLRRDPTCAICGGRATDLHEVICPLRKKYNPKTSLIAHLVYSEENCVLLCNPCNVIDANSIRDTLIRHNMSIYGKEAVISVYRDMARILKSPRSWIPENIECWGEWVRIL